MEENLILVLWEWYEENGIKLCIGELVIVILIMDKIISMYKGN